jgi:hypothetical protein
VNRSTIYEYKEAEEDDNNSSEYNRDRGLLKTLKQVEGIIERKRTSSLALGDPGCVCVDRPPDVVFIMHSTGSNSDPGRVSVNPGPVNWLSFLS